MSTSPRKVSVFKESASGTETMPDLSYMRDSQISPKGAKAIFEMVLSDTQNQLTDALFSMDQTVSNLKLTRDLLQAAYENGRRNFCGVNLEGEDLAHLCLVGADFTGANLKASDLSDIESGGAVFKDAAISGARLDRPMFLALYAEGHRDFCQVNLSRANLRNISVEHANFSGANLEFSAVRGMRMYQCNLENIHVFGAYMDGEMVTSLYNAGHRDFRVVNLSGASLFDATLSNADFTGSSFDFADLRGADIVGSKFSKASFYGAKLDRQTLKVLFEIGHRDFRSVNLSYANLRRLSLVGANFREANFFGTNLMKTDFSHANLEKADMRQAQLASIHFDEHTNRRRVKKDLIKWLLRR